MNLDPSGTGYPVISDLRYFDRQSGSVVERLVFNHRLPIFLFFLFLSAVLGLGGTQLKLNASFEKTIPVRHPYMVNYFAHKEDLNGSGNAVRIALETTQGTIFESNYFDTLRRVNDEIFLLPGVDRPYMKSLWMPSVRWTGVTEEGLEGGAVIPDGYTGSNANLAQVRANIERSGEIGQLVAADYRSSVIFVPLLDRDAETGKPLDYRQFANAVEKIRDKYQTTTLKIHVTGFAKVMGDLIEGLGAMLSFFAFASVTAATLLYWHTRCIRSTLLVVLCSLAAVVWLLGLLHMLGYGLNPYSILVLFLVFAIGMSHGAQKMNGIMQDIGRGTQPFVAARYCFRRLFLAGFTALLADTVGFAVLALIPIAAIQELAVAASLGMAGLIFTILIMLPVLLSYCGVNTGAARKSIGQDTAKTGRNVFRHFDIFTRRKGAACVILAAGGLWLGGFWMSTHLKIGDLNPGAPELRADSRYNRDNAFMVEHYAASSDVLITMAQTPPFQCAAYDTLTQIDALESMLQQLPQVVSTESFAGLSKWAATGMNEGNPKWYGIPRTQDMLNAMTDWAPRDLFNQNCNLLFLYVYLTDHKAETLQRVTQKIETFAATSQENQVKFLLAAGSAGIEAATNDVIEHFHLRILGLIYLSVGLLCFVAFRSWRAVTCAILPLALTSILCQALMVALGIGVKVATLPVIALGVGIGVDYALYILTLMLARLREGMSLTQAYHASMLFTGKIVVLTGMTLGIAVGTWIFSPIKFQADMGLLLAFMFFWNMLGALILLPALATFLFINKERVLA